MAYYINVAEWSPDMVTDWLKGLDNSMYHYVQSFTNNGVGGKQLLNIRPYELEQLGMNLIGHQEIVLEAVENLKNFNYNLDKENLQFLALHVTTAAHSLTKQLKYSNQEKLETAVLKDITRTITHLKALIEWLDRAPFKGLHKFDELRQQCMRFGLEMATVAMRDRFSLNPVQAIQNNASKLADIGEYIIKDITDPIILQPASLDLVTLKKRESDLGFLIMQSFHGVHRITEIKFNSPAHNSGKVEEGDEIVQINYQTVVGWEYKKVLLQLQESPPDVLLTLKKRPKHLKIYGQIYIKPYRLPSKKRSLPYRWGESLPSPRITDTFALQDFSLPLQRVPEKQVPSDTESEGSDIILTPTDAKETEKEIRLYLPKPRAVLQRRHTLSSFKDLVGVGSWHERTATGGKRPQVNELQSLRDKSVSFGFGLEMAPRPSTTCLGLVGNGAGGATVDGAGAAGVATKCSSFGGLQSSLPDIVPTEGGRSRQDASPNEVSVSGSAEGAGDRRSGDSEAYKAGVSKVVRFESSSKADQCHVDTKYTCKVDNTVLETFEPIPYVDEDLPVVTASRPTVTERVKRFESFATRSTGTPAVVTNGHHGASANGQSAINSTPLVVPLKPIPMQRHLAKEPEALAEAINSVVVNREMVKRGRLDKSYSTPAYDDELGDIPPAIEPRKEHLLKAPPVPPPRPKRTLETLSAPIPEKPPPTTLTSWEATPFSTEPGFVSSLSNAHDNRDDNSNKSKLANVIDLKQNRTQPPPLTIVSATPPKPAERNSNTGTPTATNPAPPIPASRPSIPPPTPTVPSVATDASSSSELLTPNKTKSLTLKKKHSLLSKRRNVSLKTLCVSDIQGHLYRRTKDRSGVSYWAKYYFVLIETTLYGFRSKEAPKANSMIFLAGFTISPAKEVHSRPHAFKVYHPNKTFYFAAETQEALVQWMEYIKQATLKGSTGGATGGSTTEHNVRELFSETDSSDDELGLMDSTTKLNLLCTPSPQLSSSHSLTSGHHEGGTPTSSTKHDTRYHLNFGSLKKFTKIGSDASGGVGGNGATPTSSSGNGAEGSKFFGFFSSHRSVEKSNSSEMPVPTSQFKSYRKVPGASGLQIGTASNDGYPLPSLLGGTVGGAGLDGSMSVSNLSLASVNGTREQPVVGEKLVPPPAPPPRPTTPGSPKPSLNVPPICVIREPPATPKATISEAAELLNRAQKSKRISPHNYIHASNPNLVEFDFQTSKAMDFSVPKIHAGNTWDTSTHSHSNLQSMITLKDLMLQKQAEEAQDMYNKRVCLGVEKLDERGKKSLAAAQEATQAAGGAAGGSPAPIIPEAVNKIQRRQLPITPDYAQSFKLDDEDILYTRSKEGQKLRDFGYEMISGDDAFDQRNRTNRSFGGSGSVGGTNGSGSLFGTNGNSTSGTGGSGGGGSIKKKTFNWINSDRKGDTSGGDGGTASGSGIGGHTMNASSSSGGGSSTASGGASLASTSLSLRDSFKRSKNKAVIARLDNIKASSEKLFQFKQTSIAAGGSNNNNDKESLKTKQLDKPGAPGALVNLNLKHQSPQTTPFGVVGKKNSNELHAALEHHSSLLFQQGLAMGGVAPIGAGIKKSNTCNSSSDFKENSSKLQNMRKNSAPERTSTAVVGSSIGGGSGGSSGSTTSYFTNLSFGRSKTTKEKKWLASPRLHRAIFGKNHHANDHQPTVIDHEVFSPISYTKSSPAGQSANVETSMTAGAGNASIISTSSASSGAVLTAANFGANGGNSRNSPDYPNMEYPPVFEPETYSLSDPSTSQTLLKRRQNHHHPHQPHQQQHHHHQQQK